MYLFDASSIINLVKRGLTTPLSEGATLDLALYECVSALWKEHLLLGVLDEELALEFIGIISDLFKVIPVYSVEGRVGEIFGLAVKEGITPYDASYLYVALENGLTLVTDDKRLLKAALKYTGVLTTSRLLDSLLKK